MAAAGGDQPGHRGVLFLDEMPEFGLHTLEMLRQPLEDRVVSISRSAGSPRLPGQLHAGRRPMNPCPCGYYGDAEKESLYLPPPWSAKYQKPYLRPAARPH